MFARYFEHATDVQGTIDSVGLNEKSDERIGRLSGGQKRRLDVALGLVGDPEVLFLDEPTTGLDPVARREMWSMIERLRSAGKTIFLTTHYMDEAEHLADRIIILRAGVIAAQGTPVELSATLGYHTEITFEPSAGFDMERLRGVLGAGVSWEASVVRFKTNRVQDDMAVLLEWAKAERVVLDKLQAIRPSLDEVFVKVAGEATGAHGASL
jgi:ABC-2 type transport system ATP-binding protein